MLISTMAKGSLTIHLDGSSTRKLAERAEAAGLSPEDWVAQLVQGELLEPADFDWGADDPDAPLPPLDLREPTHAFEDVAAEVRARLAEAKRRTA